MKKLNCWEVIQCGREPGGAAAARLGVCPASVDLTCDGLNGGRNAGRICWTVVGTASEGAPSSSLCLMGAICSECSFFKRVREEEGILHFLALRPDQLPV